MLFARFFLVKCSNNSLSYQVVNYICSWHSNFHFFYNKNFINTFCKRFLACRYSYMVTNSKFRIFIDILFSGFDTFFFFRFNCGKICIEFTSTSVVYVALKFLLIYWLPISKYQLNYQYRHFLILKSYICKFCSLRIY